MASGIRSRSYSCSSPKSLLGKPRIPRNFTAGDSNEGQCSGFVFSAQPHPMSACFRPVLYIDLPMWKQRSDAYCHPLLFSHPNAPSCPPLIHALGRAHWESISQKKYAKARAIVLFLEDAYTSCLLGAQQRLWGRSGWCGRGIKESEWPQCRPWESLKHGRAIVISTGWGAKPTLSIKLGQRCLYKKLIIFLQIVSNMLYF